VTVEDLALVIGLFALVGVATFTAIEWFEKRRERRN
jgi:hypothetical protein